MTLRALCIGINDYPGTDSDLDGCVNDASDWTKTLTARGFTVGTILDRRATKKRILTELERLITATRPGDCTVITYSGHGTWIPDTSGDDPDTRDEALCPWDVVRDGPLVDDDLYTLFSHRPRGSRVILITDSCHSGGVNRAPPAREPEHHPDKIRFLPPQTFLASRTLTRALRANTPPRPLRTSALLLSACKSTEVAWDAWFRDRPNGAFTHHALRELRTLGPTATYRNWLHALRRRLPSRNYPQTPQLHATTTQRGWNALR